MQKLIIVFLVGIVSSSAFCVEHATVAFQVYYSADDPKWKAAEPVIDAVAQKFPELKAEKICIDTLTGYNRLAKDEADLHIDPKGDLTLIFGPYTLTSKGERRDVETYFEAIAGRLLHPESAKLRLPTDPVKYAENIFGKDLKLESVPYKGDADLKISKVLKDGKAAGWVVEAYYHITCPICNDVEFNLAAAPDGKVLDVSPVKDLERRGLKLSEKEAAAFTGQYKNRAPKDPPPAKPDAITGATRTSMAYELTVKEILEQLKKLAEKP